MLCRAARAAATALLLAYGTVITGAIVIGTFVQRTSAEWTELLRGLGLP